MKIVFSIAGTVEFQVQTNPTDLQPIPCQELNSLSRFWATIFDLLEASSEVVGFKIVVAIGVLLHFGFGNKVIY